MGGRQGISHIHGSCMRKGLVILVLVVSVVLGLSHVRFFPFSDYLVFAFAQMNRKALVLYVKDSNGEESILPARFISPFNRLHIQQMGWIALKNKEDLSWIGFFGQRYKAEFPNTKQILLKRVQIEPHPEQTFSITQTKTLFEKDL